MEKHYDYLTENKQGQVVVASYDPETGAYDCPGGFKFFGEDSDGYGGAPRNLGNLTTYVED